MQSTAAMKRLDIDISQMDHDQLSGENLNMKDFSIEIDVEDNDPSDSITTKLEVPVSLMFSSVPLIREIYPTILLSYGASNVSSVTNGGPSIDVTADLLGLDVKMCSVGGILVPIVRLSPNQVRCEVPVQLLMENSQYKLFLVTSAGMASNTQTFSVMQPLALSSVSPTGVYVKPRVTGSGNYRHVRGSRPSVGGSDSITITTSSVIPGTLSLYCVFAQIHANGHFIENTLGIREETIPSNVCCRRNLQAGALCPAQPPCL